MGKWGNGEMGEMGEMSEMKKNGQRRTVDGRRA